MLPKRDRTQSSKIVPKFFERFLKTFRGVLRCFQVERSIMEKSFPPEFSFFLWEVVRVVQQFKKTLHHSSEAYSMPVKPWTRERVVLLLSDQKCQNIILCSWITWLKCSQNTHTHTRAHTNNWTSYTGAITYTNTHTNTNLHYDHRVDPHLMGAYFRRYAGFDCWNIF